MVFFHTDPKRVNEPPNCEIIKTEAGYFYRYGFPDYPCYDERFGPFKSERRAIHAARGFDKLLGDMLAAMGKPPVGANEDGHS